MMQIKVQGQKIRFKGGYACITDIAKSVDSPPNEVIRNWLKNRKTVLFLEAWEQLHNPDFKHVQMDMFKIDTLHEGRVTIKRYLDTTEAIGIRSEAGRYGGTYAHIEIAFEFAAWLNPHFKVYFFQEWVKMKEAELEDRGIDFFLEKSISNADEIGNFLREIKSGREERRKLNSKQNLDKSP